MHIIGMGISGMLENMNNKFIYEQLKNKTFL